MFGMSPTAVVPALAVSGASPADVETDLIAVPIFEGDDPAADLRALDDATGNALMRALESREVEGRPYEIFITTVTNAWRAGRIAFIGAGKRADFTTERLRRVATAAALQARQRRVQRFAWLNRGDIPLPEAVQAAAEGLVLAAFSGDRYKSGDRAAPALDEILILAGGPEDDRSALEARVERGQILGDSSNLARELSQRAVQRADAAVFAERAAAIAGRGPRRRGSRRERDRRSSGWACCSASRAAARSRRA